MGGMYQKAYFTEAASIVRGELMEKTYFGDSKPENMSVQVDRYIAELLYQQDKVVVPGLGVFSLTYKSSQVDPVQGMLTPPVKAVSFQANLGKQDETRLIDHISASEGIGREESRQAIREYVQSAQEKLQRKELVLIDQIGRLYLDFEGNLQFLPDATNFDTSTFGLPPISAQPVPTSPEPVPNRVEATYGSTSNTSEVGGFIQQHLGTIIGIALIIIVIFILALSYQRFFGDPSDDPISRVPEDRHNVPPPPVDSSRIENDSALDFPLDDSQNSDEGLVDPEIDDYDDRDAGAVTPPPGQREAIIAIGIFRDKENVNNLVERIYKAGYEPYLDERGGRTRVGIQFSYQEFSEVQEALKVARRKFAPDAFIMER